MARPLRIQYPGAIYHVTFRGNDRKPIFKSDADRQRLLEAMAHARDLHQTRIFLVCLMPNHVHLLLETPRGNLSAFMRQILTAYTVYFNRRHRRIGHLLQGRFQARIVEGDDYLLKLSRYVHLNPVSGRHWQGQPVDARRRFLEHYRWSTYRSYAGEEKPWSWIDYAPMLALVGGKGRTAAARYAAYIQLGLAENDEAFGRIYRTSRLGVGSEDFVRDLELRYQRMVTGKGKREDAAFRKPMARRSVEEVLEGVAEELGVEVARLRERHRESWLRPMAAWALQRHGGLNQREVAVALGLGTGAAVSQQLAKWRREVQRDSSWRNRASRIDRRLEQKANY
ncbi:MAG TPA: transposase [Candidatus Paceibacterota bacterium]|nr:transposase [Verrucomicrobiota bacterium]HRY49058.1 transposase [Candidatus Paceibacterota bacterium]HRZ99148.1 transposase [Candidatus Paceibacterota bacterium]